MLSFGTKSSTLNKLKNKLKSTNLLPQVSFKVDEWKEKKELILKKIKNLNSSKYAVRSSSLNEDTSSLSNAGKYLSLLNVELDDIPKSINEVISSYGEYYPDSEVLIQPMLQNVIFSGVAFSHDPSNSSPYRIINWTENSKTDQVTSGKKCNIWRQVPGSIKSTPKSLRPVIDLIEELYALFNLPLDIEFAASKYRGVTKLFLLQVRQLILYQTKVDEKIFINKHQAIANKIKLGMKPHPFLMGKKTVYGVMPDWNPAEIIGIRPRPLSLSLYRELVTDSIWAYQRDNYGYRNLRSFPLMQSFYGLPYIDVRLSFNSFIPSSLNDKTANKLVDYYIEKLINSPSLHDKIEFEIVFSCYDLDIEKRLNLLKKYKFSNYDLDSISTSLKEITNQIINLKNGLWIEDAKKLNILENRRSSLYSFSSDIPEIIYWLIEDVKRYGTLPFAGLARAGFIAVQFLRSMISSEIMDENDYQKFISSISTIGSELTKDRYILTKTNFLKKYGHLRPGTYDILSYRYDEKPDFYFNWKSKNKKESFRNDFSLNLTKMKKLDKLLKDHQLNIDPVGLFEFIQNSIELREKSKFLFTKSLSDALSYIEKFGVMYGFTREDLSFSNINVFKNIYITADDPRLSLQESISIGKESYKSTLTLSLPPLITSTNDVWGHSLPDTEPNFITQKEVISLVTNTNNIKNLKGNIVFIPNADPGYDWIFSYEIAGLITTWGGSNSHMAIRAGELGIPSVIGCGEKLYDLWSNSKKLKIDCAAKLVEIIA